MVPLFWRRLTAAEQALAREVFGSGIDPVRVRLFAIPVWDRAFTPGAGLMVWPAAEAHRDLAAATTPSRERATFVHEMTHVWQAQRGVNLIVAKLKAGDSDASYRYDLINGPPFPLLNIEQQARVVEHAYLAALGERVQHPAALYDAIRHHWRTA